MHFVFGPSLHINFTVDVDACSFKDPKDFFVAFDDMLEYLSEDGIEQQVMDELSSRNVKCMNFYDICLDYILIDSFEDLESPPSSVLAVMKNRWLSNSFKESNTCTCSV